MVKDLKLPHAVVCGFPENAVQLGRWYKMKLDVLGGGVVGRPKCTHTAVLIQPIR